jgi:hypothetical protein
MLILIYTEAPSCQEMHGLNTSTGMAMLPFLLITERQLQLEHNKTALEVHFSDCSVYGSLICSVYGSLICTLFMTADCFRSVR